MKFRLVISGNGDKDKVTQVAGEARAYLESEGVKIQKATLQSDGKPDADIPSAERGGRPQNQGQPDNGGQAAPAPEKLPPSPEQQPPPNPQA